MASYIIYGCRSFLLQHKLIDLSEFQIPSYKYAAIMMLSLTAASPPLIASSPISTNGEAPLPTAKQLLTFDQVPEWKQTNPHILTGYRPISNSYKVCLASWTFIHNETMNTYSHLLLVFPVAGILLRSALVLMGKVESLTAPRTEDILVFGVFFLGALACMGFSAAYHTLMCHSEAVANLTRQFDYIGITCLIYGSFVPTIYYIFTCETELMRTYMMTVSVVPLENFSTRAQ